MTRVFHAWPYDRFLEIYSNFGEGNFIERIKAPVFLEIEMQSNLENQPQHIKRWFFFSKADPSIFTSIAPPIRQVKQKQLSFSSIEIFQLSFSCLNSQSLFFYPGFLSWTFTIHRTAGEGGGYFFKSSLPLPRASQTLTHKLSDFCRDLTSAHRNLWFPLTTKLGPLVQVVNR